MRTTIRSLPAAPEALYDAAWRWAALIEIYKTEEDAKKSDDSKAGLTTLRRRLLRKPAERLGSSRATLLYLLQQERACLRQCGIDCGCES